MDIHIIYFDESQKVKRASIGSQFMGHGAVKDIMDDFQKAHSNLNIINNLIQLSMILWQNSELDKNLKAAYGIFKKSPAQRSDFLIANDIEERNDYRSRTSYFPLKFCGHRWLEHGKFISRYLDIFEELLTFLIKYKEGKRFPPKDERFPLLLQSSSSCEFSLSIARDLEPFSHCFRQRSH